MDYTLDEFLEAWREGGAPPVTDHVALSVSNHRPYVGESVRLEWQGQAGQNVSLFCGQRPFREDQPDSGHLTLVIGSLDARVYRAQCGEASSECSVVPRVREPVVALFRIRRPLVLVGESVEIDYQLKDAQQTTLSLMREDEALRTIDVPEQEGRLTIPVPEDGRYELRIDVRSEHADISPLASVQEVLTFEATHPPAAISIFKASKRRAVIGGEPVNIQWTTINAEHVSLADHEGAERALPLSGELELDSHQPSGRQRYTLHAVNKAGESVSKTVVIRYSAPAVTIRFSTSARVVGYGEVHELSWQVKGARSVTLMCENLAAPVSEEQGGEAIIQVFEDTVYRLTAVGMDGAEHVRKLVVKVDLMPSLPVWPGVEFE
jgi:hypothetical protein